MRVTPEKIEDLEKNQVFVFGSNEMGIHGAGAAADARKWGAKIGQGFGMAGQTFAIPSKDWEIETLPLQIIHHYVSRFIEFTKREVTANWEFLVTPIATGLAGYQPEQIAPMFRELKDNPQVWLPQSFRDIYAVQDMTEVEFNTILDNHDWFYQMSEDQRVWDQGYANEKHIKSIIKLRPEFEKLYIAKGDEMFKSHLQPYSKTE